MITFHAIGVRNFLSFECASISLQDLGPTLVTGINKDSNSADSNGAGKCLTGDTKISLVNGTEVAIKDLVDKDLFYVYSYDHESGKIVPGVATATKTRLNAELVEVELDNGEKVRCTPDHRWMLRNGEYKEAQDLKPSDSLMPLYRRYRQVWEGLGSKYEQVFQLGVEEYKFTHRCFVQGKLGGVVHHRNFNPRDNRPVNLQRMAMVAHRKMHGGIMSIPGVREKHLIAMQSIEYRKKQSEASRKRWRDKKYRKNVMAGYLKADVEGRVLRFSGKHHTTEAKRKIGNSSRERNPMQDPVILQKVLSWWTPERRQQHGEKIRRSWTLRRLKAQEQRVDQLVVDAINHKVVSVRHLSEREDCYDLTVDKYHNFALSAGVFVHNSAIISEALPWCLYGETLRGLPQRDVVRIGSKGGCSVRVDFSIDDINFTVERLQSSKGGSLNLRRENELINGKDKKATQARIEELLGIDFRLFVQSIILGQDSLVFAGATDAEKKRILEGVAGISVFETYLERTKGEVASLEGALAELETKRDILAQQIVTLNIESLDSKAEADQWSGETTVKCAELEQAKLSLSKHQSSTSLQLERSQVMKVASGLDELTTKRSVLITAKLPLERQIGEAQAQKRTASQAIDRLNRDVANSEVCPTCKRPYDEESVKAAKQSIESQIQLFEDTIQSSLDNLTAAQGRLKVCEDVMTELQNEIQLKEEAQKEVQRINVDIATSEGAQRQIESIDKQISDLQSAENIHLKEYERKVLQMVEVHQNLSQVEAQLSITDEELQYLKFWITGFGKKGVRSLVLDYSSKFLNEAASKYSQRLTDGEIEVVFSTQRELANGKMAEDFQVKGLNRFGADVYKGNSVGERQRVDFCVALALQDFIRHKTGTSINLLVLDEASANIDSIGSERMIELLVHLTVQGKSIFYVTHDPRMQDLFPTKIVVVKENGVSCISS